MPSPNAARVALFADDAGFVRAPIDLVDRRLQDIGTWPSWWRGLRVRPLSPVGGRQAWAIELTGRVARRLRVGATATPRRRPAGFVLHLSGDLDGRAEFWLEERGGGTVVHVVLDATTPLAHPAGVLEDARRAIRRGLWGCKDALQLEARTSAGLVP